MSRLFQPNWRTLACMPQKATDTSLQCWCPSSRLQQPEGIGAADHFSTSPRQQLWQVSVTSSDYSSPEANHCQWPGEKSSLHCPRRLQAIIYITSKLRTRTTRSNYTLLFLSCTNSEQERNTTSLCFSRGDTRTIGCKLYLYIYIYIYIYITAVYSLEKEMHYLLCIIQ